MIDNGVTEVIYKKECCSRVVDFQSTENELSISARRLYWRINRASVTESF